MLSRALELSWGAQTVACAVYAYGLFGRKGGGATAARALLWVAWATCAAALAARWSASGLMRPPWLSLPETMVFGAWMLMGLQLWAELRQGARVAGFFCTALSAAAVGTVIFKMGGFGLVAPAHPAYQRPWLWIHLPAGAIAYGLVMLGAFFSIGSLIRAGMANERLLVALGAVMFASLCWGIARDPAERAAYVAIAGLGGFLLFSLLGFWLENLDRRLIAERELSTAKNAKLPARRGWWRVARWVFGASWIAYLVALWRLRSALTPDALTWLVFLAVLAGGALLLVLRRKAIQERLPEPENLDDWASQAVLLAFPWLTFHLVSGSVWAYEVWGSYWSWRPGQGWTLVAWLYLALLLHLKPGKVSTDVARAAAVIWVMAAIAAGGTHGFWPVRF